MRLRILAVSLAVMGLVGVGLFAAAPADAATKNAGIPDITPYGGYLGNYLAPDGTRVYCIDSSLEWPSGATSAPSSVDSLVTTWGATLTADQVQSLNYVLLTYGQTDDAVQAAAVAAFVNAYTSGWARDIGAGYGAGAWYLNGNATVTAVYDTIWADASANANPVGTAALAFDAATSTVSVTATPSSATGTLTLSGAARADTGETSFPVSASETIMIRATPSDEAREHVVEAEASFAANLPAGPGLVLYTTPGQQRTIRGGAPGSIAFTASTESAAMAFDFAPVVTTAVESTNVEVGRALVDRVTMGLAEGSRPWRTRSDGTAVSITADGVLYGPFDEQPAQSDAVPPGAPVAGVESLTFSGPGELQTSGSTVAAAEGYYTWVWSIAAAKQDVVGAASLPLGYSFVSPFGVPEETHLVVAPPPRLADTGSEPRDAGLIAGALVGLGVLLIANPRGALRLPHPTRRAAR